MFIVTETREHELRQEFHVPDSWTTFHSDGVSRQPPSRL
jgi:hypothetical protein